MKINEKCHECGHSWSLHINTNGCVGVLRQYTTQVVGGSEKIRITIRCLCQRLPWEVQGEK